MKSYEVEIKTLLGSKENADKLKKDIRAAYPDMKLVFQGKQLNHYFNTPSSTILLTDKIISIIPGDKQAAFKDVLSHGKKMSIRTRDADGTVIFVIKASVGDDTSSNGVKRVEFESVVKQNLAQLDQILLDAGCTYQAKWSREREEYSADDMHVCIDKNAGYGYLAEFEKVISDENELDKTRGDLISTMAKLGVSELPQDRLERMFAHYNAHWFEYYGTQKTFIIE